MKISSNKKNEVFFLELRDVSFCFESPAKILIWAKIDIHYYDTSLYA